MAGSLRRWWFGEDRRAWTSEQWRAHLLAEARTQRERDEVYAIFSRH